MKRSLSLLLALNAWLLAGCEGMVAAPGGDTVAKPDAGRRDAVDGGRITVSDLEPDSRLDGRPDGSLTIVSIAADRSQVDTSGKVELTVSLKSTLGQELTQGQVWIEGKAPDGSTTTKKTTGISLVAQGTTVVKQTLGPFSVIGTWVFSPTLRSDTGQILAGPVTGATVKVTVPLVCGAFLPSGVKAGEMGYSYRWYYTCVENRDPACGRTGVLVYGRQGMEWMGDLCVNKGFKHPASWGGYWTYEGAFWCCQCDSDYDGVTGYDHSYTPTRRLKIVYGPIPISGPNDKPPGAPQ